MANLSKRKTLFGLLAIAGTIPAARMAEAFDLLRVDDITRAPSRQPALFGSLERIIGKPTELFPPPSANGRPCASSTAMADSLEMLNGLNDYGIKGQIAGINTYLNNMKRIEDITCNIKSKHWAAPIAYFKSDEGSEDYAIAKYIFLRKLGFHHDRLRVVWVEEEVTRIHHAVLAVILDGQTFILENRFAEITNDIMLPNYLPYCSANETRFSLHWSMKQRGGVMASLDRLARRPRNASS